MKIACYVDADRPVKSHRIISAFAKGCGGTITHSKIPVPDADEHVVYGSWAGNQKLIPLLEKQKAPYWFIDNGWCQPGKGGPGYYRVSRNGPAPTFIPGRSMDRALSFGVEIKPWTRSGSHVLVCLQSDLVGRPWGLDPVAYYKEMEGKVRAMTDRPVVVRPKTGNAEPLEKALGDCWAVVTHSSNCAVQAVLAGIPAFCEPWCWARSVAHPMCDLCMIEIPGYTDYREPWIASLAWQQFSLDELSNGFAWGVIRETA